VVCLDLVLRPAILWQRSVWLPACIAALLFLVRERVWQVVGLPVGAIFAGLVIAAATVIALARTTWLGGRLATIRYWPSALPDRKWLDVLFMVALWVTSVPVSYVLARTTSAQQSLYLWSQLSGRSLGLIRLLLFLAAASGIVSLLRVRKKAWSLTASAALCAASAYFVLQRIPEDSRGVVNDLSSGLHDMDRVLSAPDSTPGTAERMIYYAVSKSVDTGHDATAQLLK
jgi:hypothetical protein